MTVKTRDARFEWSDDFLLGHGPMDDVHQEFVEIVCAMQEAPDQDVAPLLERFASHAKAHFESEDAWMAETDFPARACHIDEHAAVLKSVHAIQRRVANGDSQAARRLATELRAWFPGHAQHLDSALAHWMCKLRLGGKPVVLRRRADATRHPS